MTFRRFAFATLAAASLATPALAGGADGAWECRSFGVLIATIGIQGDGYVFANPNGPSGSGAIDFVNDKIFAISSGPLLTDLGIQGGDLRMDNGEPMLSLGNARGAELFCYEK